MLEPQQRATKSCSWSAALAVPVLFLAGAVFGLDFENQPLGLVGACDGTPGQADTTCTFSAEGFTFESLGRYYIDDGTVFQNLQGRSRFLAPEYIVELEPGTPEVHPLIISFSPTPYVSFDVYKVGGGTNVFRYEALDAVDQIIDVFESASDATVAFASPAPLIASIRLGTRKLGQSSFSGIAIDNLTVDICGDGVIGVGEQCDDGNTAEGDCCSSTCQYEASGSSCMDGNPCTVDACDGAGSCHTDRPTGCKAAGKSLLLLKNNVTDDSKDKLTWKWLKGAETTLGQLGNPIGGTGYTLCLYAGSASAAVALPAGSNWQATGMTGFKYRDLSGFPKALVKIGAASTSKALVKVKGINVPDSLVPMLSLPVTVQLVNDENGSCFETVYNTATTNSTTQFKAKTP